jgi:hypothetical protein
MGSPNGVSYSISVRVSEFQVPPVTDALVLGKNAPIGFAAISKAISLLAANHMQSIELQDDVISHIIVRRTMLRRIPEEKLVVFVLERIKPLMSDQEVLHLDIKAEVVFEETGL